ncbi:MAG: glycosyl transferase [Calditrichales bacterium]|nr:MAG: glycosyl transferase [Calditrichales bacterium]
MNYGYFDDENREYIITDPRTPVRWINYIGTLQFGGFVDHTGGALICKGDPALNRITKYMPQLPAANFNGESLYIRIKENDEYVTYSPFFVPTLTELDRFETHVGLGYSRFISEFMGIRVEVIVFIPEGEAIEIRDIRVTNNNEIAQNIDVIPVVEYTHPDALKQYTNADWIPQTMVSRVEKEASGLVILKQYPFMYRDRRVNFFTSNKPVSSFESDRQVFLGDYGYQSYQNPAGFKSAELSNTQANRGDNIGALMHHLGEIEPGETRRVITQLGQTERVDQVSKVASRFRKESEVDQKFQELEDFWNYYLSKMQIQTPNKNLDHMINIHNPRQCFITKNWSRYLSLYQLGLGDRGIGFRDSSQDVLGVIGFIPEEAGELVKKLLNVQKQDGAAMHQFNPLTMIGTTGEAEDGTPGFYSDDHLWVILSVTAYLKETGNLAFLDENIPFYEKDKENIPIESGTVLEHLSRGIEFTRTRVGEHGLPLLGFADWNDTVNLSPGAESVFTACLYGVALKELIKLAKYLGQKDQVLIWQKYYQEMKTRVNEQAWDGEWYLRYFDSDGSPIGSKQNERGKIFTNAQSWAVLAGYADESRGRIALDSVKKYLDTKHGIKLSTPGYNGFDPNKGGVSTYPPGAKENGGIFLHANPWVMIAETMLGDGDQAFAYYNRINPVAKNDQIDIYQSEPYVYPQNILGDEHPQFGLARNSWLTGTASWAYIAATKYILGIQPGYEGLYINPCIPKDWEGFQVKRKIRGAVYDIRIKKDQSNSKELPKGTLNGKDLPDNIIPYLSDGKVHHVVVAIS